MKPVRHHSVVAGLHHPGGDVEMDVSGDSGSLPAAPRRPPPPLPSAILGLVLANFSATSSPVIFSFAGSQLITSAGLRLDSPVGSRTAVLTPSIVETRLEMVSS